jgi:hypothetical protein
MDQGNMGVITCNIHTQANECNYDVVSSNSTGGVEAPCEVSAEGTKRDEVHQTVC